MASGVKANTVADAEFQHLGMRAHLLQETKPFDNPVVQVDKFNLTQPVDIDLCHLPPSNGEIVTGDETGGNHLTGGPSMNIGSARISTSISAASSDVRLASTGMRR